MAIKRIAGCILSAVMCTLMPLGAYAADDIVALRENTLVRLGLTERRALDQLVTREEAITAVVSILGMADTATAMDDECTFTDVSATARGFVAYAAANNITNITETLFRGTNICTLRELCTFYLRGLGYGDNIYDTAIETAVSMKLTTKTEDTALTGRDLIDVSYNILFVRASGDSALVIRRLVDTNATSKYLLSNVGDDGLVAAYLSSSGTTSSRSGAGVRGNMTEAASIVLPDQVKKLEIKASGLTTIKDGMECTQLDIGARLALSIDREYMTANDKYCTVIVTYFDHGVDKIRVSYQDKILAYANQYIQKTNTLTWKSYPVVIRDAAFSQKQEQGADLTIWAESENGAGTAEFISQVTVVKQTQEEQPALDTGEAPIPTLAFIELQAIPTSLLMNQFFLNDENWYGYTKAVEIEGEQCAQLAVGKRLVLFLDDDFMDPGDNRCRISITYFDRGTNRIRFAYSTESERYKMAYINKSNTETWQTFTVEVDDASFMNRQDGFVDFTIWGVNENESDTGEELEYIKRVEVERL